MPHILYQLHYQPLAALKRSVEGSVGQFWQDSNMIFARGITTVRACSVLMLTVQPGLSCVFAARSYDILLLVANKDRLSE